MNTPPLNARTRATAAVFPQLDLDGATVMVVVIKQRYFLDFLGHVDAAKGAEIRPVDVPWDPDAEMSSTKYPNDLCIRKPSTDVVVVGAAVARDAKPVRELDVMVRVGPVEKALRVFGLRVWYEGLSGLTLTPPEPFEAQELRWENAFGGMDTSDPKTAAHEPRNPVGKGVAASPQTLVHQPGPCIEDPRDLIRTHRSRPAPAGMGAVAAGWMPRLAYAGTMDGQWQRERMPLRPADFDERFNQAATPDLIAPQHLRGGEEVRVLNMNAEGPLSFALPKRAFFVGGEIDGEMQEHRPALDTVLIEPSAMRLELTWRSAIRCPRPARRFRSIHVFDKEVLR